jgi:hypothetical protein
MSPGKEERTPFAIGLDDTIYVSVFEFDGVRSLDDAIKLVRAEAEEDLFIGLRVTRSERRRVERAFGDAAADAAAHLVASLPRGYAARASAPRTSDASGHDGGQPTTVMSSFP